MDIYAVKDKGCGIVHVFIANNVIVAKRSMAELMERNPNELMNRYAADFDLLKLAKIDENSGELSEQKIEYICNMTSLQRSER